MMLRMYMLDPQNHIMKVVCHILEFRLSYSGSLYKLLTSKRREREKREKGNSNVTGVTFFDETGWPLYCHRLVMRCMDFKLYYFQDKDITFFNVRSLINITGTIHFLKTHICCVTGVTWTFWVIWPVFVNSTESWSFK